MKRIGCALGIVLLVTACDPNQMNNAQLGQLLGGSTGALAGAGLGSLFGGHSRGAATLAGAGIGALAGVVIGGAIGARLDARDQQRATQATAVALTRGSGSWHSDHTGASGQTVVTHTQKEASGGECKTVREVAYIKGEQVNQTQRYCRDANGGWSEA
jgi:surface antigen